jgi:RHS repeat-associated protein
MNINTVDYTLSVDSTVHLHFSIDSTTFVRNPYQNHYTKDPAVAIVYNQGSNLFYFGARYYDAELGRWTSVDPKAQFFDLFAYAGNGYNPIIATDPDGQALTPETVWDGANVVIGAGTFTVNIASGNVFGAVIDGVGLAYDVTAMFVPILPGGASSIIKGKRLADAAKAIQNESKLTDVMKTALRSQARSKFFKANPGLRRSAKELEIHHIIPLEYAHLIKNLDVNNINNLVGLTKDKHEIVSSAWTTFRAANKNPSAEQVLKLVEQITKMVQ